MGNPRLPPQPIMGAPAEAPPRTGSVGGRGSSGAGRVASAAAGRKEFRGSGAERAAQRSLQAEERSSSLRPGLCPYKAPSLLTASVSPPAPWSGACLRGQSLGWGTGVNSREPLGRRTNEHCLARVEQSLAGMPPLQGLSPLPGLPTSSPKGMMGCGPAGSH